MEKFHSYHYQIWLAKTNIFYLFRKNIYFILRKISLTTWRLLLTSQVVNRKIRNPQRRTKKGSLILEIHWKSKLLYNHYTTIFLKIYSNLKITETDFLRHSKRFVQLKHSIQSRACSASYFLYTVISQSFLPEIRKDFLKIIFHRFSLIQRYYFH